MLDRTINNYESKVVAITKEIEKTISPDKVTEMYDAVREQVEKDIIRTIIVKDNNLNGVIMEVRDQLATLQKKILFKFTLNNKEYIKTDFEAEKHWSDYELAEKLYEYFKQTIADKLVKDNIYLVVGNKLNPKV